MIEVLLALVDTSFQLTGVAVLWAFLSRASRGGVLRDPLARPLPAEYGPTILDVLAVFAVYVLAAEAARSIVAGAGSVDAAPGSDAWHRFAVGQSAVKAAGAVASLLILNMRGLFRNLPERMSAGRLGLLGAAIALAAMAVCYPQLQFARWAWSEFAPLPPDHPTLEALSNNSWGNWGLVHLVISAVVVAPVAEELFHRGVILECVLAATRRPWLAIVLSALAFAAVHRGPDQFPLFSLGLVLGFVRIRYRDLRVVILAHALFNGRTMAFSLLAPG